MKALVHDGGWHLDETRPCPQPGPGEALIRVTLAGICNTDIEIAKGYMDFQGIPGHEFVGRVETVADHPAAHWKGKRVVGEINCSCGNCTWCAAGLGLHCPTRTTLGIAGKDGCFAEFMTLPLENLHEVPDTVSDESAVFTEPLAAALAITDRVHVRPTDRVAVLGDGKLGLLIALVLQETNAKMILLGKHEEKMHLAQANGIATRNVTDIEEGTRYDIVVEATGSAAGLEHATRLLKPRGTLVLKSTVASGVPLNLSPLVVNEITIVGSRCGAFAPALRHLAKNRAHLEPLIARVFPLTQGTEAIRWATQKGTLKVLLSCTH